MKNFDSKHTLKCCDRHFPLQSCIGPTTWWKHGWESPSRVCHGGGICQHNLMRNRAARRTPAFLISIHNNKKIWRKRTMSEEPKTQSSELKAPTNKRIYVVAQDNSQAACNAMKWLLHTLVNQKPAPDILNVVVIVSVFPKPPTLEIELSEEWQGYFFFHFFWLLFSLSCPSPNFN